MESNYISSPDHLKYMEERNSEVLGKPVNFRKTFNLNGTENDDMLRDYLRKAGLSDEIECLSPEQRRAFIYDIIKSNKIPGHWMPSTMNTAAFARAPPAVRPPPPPPLRTNTNTSSPYLERRNEPTTPMVHYATMSSSSSSGSLKSLAKSSPSMPHRFVAAPVTPPSPSTFVTSSKGSKYEISGPMNFVHIAGDMTRDMTRNAFDLSSANDNVLKKYMIEKGITEDDVSGMRKPDLIRKIVQSKYTWMPPKRNATTSLDPPNVVYATISKNNVITPPPSPEPLPPQLSTTPGEMSVSNFSLITSRFADPSEFPSPSDLFGNNATVVEPVRKILPPLPPQALRPPPPPRTSTAHPKKTHAPAPPPPPTAVTAKPNSSNVYHSSVETETNNFYETIPDQKNKLNGLSQDALYVVPKPQKKPLKPKHAVPPATMKSTGPAQPPPPPPPPPPPLPLMTQANMGTVIPPPPPPPSSSSNNGGVPLPPPISQYPSPIKSSAPSGTVGGDPRDALLDSIRKGAVLKKVDKNPDKKMDQTINQKAATISGVKPRAERPPPPTDFLSELKLGLTLRRVKNPENNPYSGDEPDESTA